MNSPFVVVLFACLSAFVAWKLKREKEPTILSTESSAGPKLPLCASNRPVAQVSIALVATFYIAFVMALGCTQASN